jgi:hypothetical protein
MKEVMGNSAMTGLACYMDPEYLEIWIFYIFFVKHIMH